EHRIWSSLRHAHAEALSVVSAWGGLHVHGHPLSASAVFAGLESQRVALPRSTFQHQRFWLESPRTGSASRALPLQASVAIDAGPWKLAGKRSDLPAGGVLHTIEIGPGVQPYLADHLVYGKIVVPGAFHVAVLLSIAAHHYPDCTL